MFVVTGVTDGARTGPIGRRCLALAGRGLAAVADATFSHDPRPADRAVEIALTAIERRDAVSPGPDLRPRPKADSRATLLASVEAAHELLHRADGAGPAEHGSPTSLAAVLLEETEAFVAWAGFRGRVHLVRDGAFELLTSTRIPSAGAESARGGVRVPGRAGALGPCSAEIWARSRSLRPFISLPIRFSAATFSS